jgi:hypothetical protein
LRLYDKIPGFQDSKIPDSMFYSLPLVDGLLADLLQDVRFLRVHSVHYCKYHNQKLSSFMRLPRVYKVPLALTSRKDSRFHVLVVLVGIQTGEITKDTN